MSKLILDADFFQQWDQAYSQVDNDESQYQKLLAKVKQNFTQSKKINYQTFLQIIIWKSPRITNLFLPKNFSLYQQALSGCYHLPLPENIQLLDSLYGIGLPVASTLLHFIKPTLYPIIDFRTVAVLHEAGLLTHQKINLATYLKFFGLLHYYQQRLPQFSLRQLDRALFAYHKLKLNKK